MSEWYAHRYVCFWRRFPNEDHNHTCIRSAILKTNDAGSSQIQTNPAIICLLVLLTTCSLWLLIVPNQESCSPPAISQLITYRPDIMDTICSLIDRLAEAAGKTRQVLCWQPRLG